YPWGNEDKGLRAFYRIAINARRNSKALSEGDVTTVWIDDRGGYGFVRRSGDDMVVALFNNGPEPLQATISLDGAPDRDWDILLGSVTAHIENGTLTATIPPLGAAWLAPKNTRKQVELRQVMEFPALKVTRIEPKS